MYQKRRKRKKKEPGPIKNWSLYLLVRSVAWLISGGEPDQALATSRWLGRKFYRFYGRGRARALEHLRFAYPEKDEVWIAQTAERSFEYLVMLVFDVFLTPQLVHKHTLAKYFSYDPVELAPIFDWIEQKQSIVMVTGHYGNFEALGYALATHGLKIFTVGRPIDNPLIDHYLRSVREKQGQVIIDKRGAARQLTQVLSSGNVLALVADQNGGRKDIFVEYFGRKASTYKSIGLLAMRYKCPIVVGYCQRLEDSYKFHIGITRIIRPEDWADKDEPLAWITAEYTRGIEDFVRLDPQQYWWLHRRWRTRPPEEVKEMEKQKNKTIV